MVIYRPCNQCPVFGGDGDVLMMVVELAVAAITIVSFLMVMATLVVLIDLVSHDDSESQGILIQLGAVFTRRSGN